MLMLLLRKPQTACYLSISISSKDGKKTWTDWLDHGRLPTCRCDMIFGGVSGVGGAGRLYVLRTSWRVGEGSISKPEKRGTRHCCPPAPRHPNHPPAIDRTYGVHAASSRQREPRNQNDKFRDRRTTSKKCRRVGLAWRKPTKSTRHLFSHL